MCRVTRNVRSALSDKCTLLLCEPVTAQMIEAHGLAFDRQRLGAGGAATAIAGRGSLGDQGRQLGFEGFGRRLAETALCEAVPATDDKRDDQGGARA